MNYEAIVIGVSSGGLRALKVIFQLLPADFSIPIIIVQHINARSQNEWIKLLEGNCKLRIKEADEKEKIEAGIIYVAAANYHLMIEKNKTLSFSIDERVNFARPAIDVLFETAAEAYHKHLIGIILTGSSTDGTLGLKKIKRSGGLVIAQNPETAESAFMPQSAVSAIDIDHILDLEDIAGLLIKINKLQIRLR